MLRNPWPKRFGCRNAFATGSRKANVCFWGCQKARSKSSDSLEVWRASSKQSFVFAAALQSQRILQLEVGHFALTFGCPTIAKVHSATSAQNGCSAGPVGFGYPRCKRIYATRKWLGPFKYTFQETLEFLRAILPSNIHRSPLDVSRIEPP